MREHEAWVWQLELPGRLKWPLLVLAWRADSLGLVKLAIDDLAYLAGLSVRGWTKVAAELEQLGYIEVAERPARAPKVWRVLGPR